MLSNLRDESFKTEPDMSQNLKVFMKGTIFEITESNRTAFDYSQLDYL